MPEPNDRALILQTRGGELEAYGELVRRYQTSVYNVCYRILGERREAEDLAQETFIRAHQKLQSYDENRPFGPWIRRVATNMCLNHLQSDRHPALPLDEEHDVRADGSGSDTAAAAEARAARASIRQAIRSLPPHYRAVIELRHFQGLTYEEIADALALPLSDVKSHLFRSRKLLAQRLKADE
jgi:RNA polymerase sigma-70 factor (ECF subfamily)